MHFRQGLPIIKTAAYSVPLARSTGRSIVGMKLYKYRSLRNNIDFVLDILINQRLYCADHAELNDPVEGGFYESRRYSGPVMGISIPRSIDAAESLRVCSLSAPRDLVPLWSHYADSHAGVAIEVDLPVEPPLYRVSAPAPASREEAELRAGLLHRLQPGTAESHEFWAGCSAA